MEKDRSEVGRTLSLSDKDTEKVSVLAKYTSLETPRYYPKYVGLAGGVACWTDGLVMIFCDVDCEETYTLDKNLVVTTESYPNFNRIIDATEKESGARAQITDKAALDFIAALKSLKVSLSTTIKLCVNFDDDDYYLSIADKPKTRWLYNPGHLIYALKHMPKIQECQIAVKSGGNLLISINNTYVILLPGLRRD